MRVEAGSRVFYHPYLGVAWAPSFGLGVASATPNGQTQRRILFSFLFFVFLFFCFLLFWRYADG